MKLTKKSIEKQYGIRLERDSYNMSDEYKSWRAYVDTNEDEVEVAWCDTLAEIIICLESKKEFIQTLRDNSKER